MSNFAKQGGSKHNCLSPFSATILVHCKAFAKRHCQLHQLYLQNILLAWYNSCMNSLEKKNFRIYCCLQLVILLHGGEFLITQQKTLLSRGTLSPWRKNFQHALKLNYVFYIIVFYSISLIKHLFTKCIIIFLLDTVV